MKLSFDLDKTYFLHKVSINTYNLLGLAILLSFSFFTFSEISAIDNGEWSDIDMQFKSVNGDLTITCSKDIDVSLNMLMTVINYDTKERLSIVSSSVPVLTETITLDDSMIQVFCEYTKSNGDKAGYAIMRTFVP